MSNNVIEISNLSKQYHLGQVGTGTISHDLNRWWHRIRGQEDPYLKVGEVNDRSTISDSEFVWALQDIDLEVKRGEVLGIIGRNGSGKSTLLKILSKITAPTTGRITIEGRVASLLEVGTGFHPELTGRENIYLNGTILGMSKAEVHKKLDEIVAFAGVARYLDTPVKRYSSGMMVRLGFAVAAHLEPDILIVDEVLAVGDTEFQKKAIGKMQEVSQGEGRTILFVSHNMSSVRSLCTRAALLNNGTLAKVDTVHNIIETYLTVNIDNTSERIKQLDEVKRHERTAQKIRFCQIELNKTVFHALDKLVITCTLNSEVTENDSIIAVNIIDQQNNTVYHLVNKLHSDQRQPISKGHFQFSFNISKLRLRHGFYSIMLFVRTPHAIQDWLTNAISFQVEESSIYPYKGDFIIQGLIQPDFTFEFTDQIL